MKKYARKTIKVFKKTILLAGKSIKKLFDTWPKAFIAVVACIILAYYPLGGKMSENIDKYSEYNFELASEKRSQAVEMIVKLINREVNENLWTPNLPFFFPAYCLDNMPNFQKGIIRGLKGLTAGLVKVVQCGENKEDFDNLKNAAGLLAYPENVWLASPTNKLKMAPSSSSQYRKARKNLKKFNDALEEEKCFWVKDEKSLRKLNSVVMRGLRASERQIKNEIREGNNSWFDTSADNVFYLNQGRIYAYMEVLKKLGRDYKQVLMADGVYQDWTVMLRALQDAVELNPDMVLNGRLDSELVPNHLMSLAYYVTKAENVLLKINKQLDGENKNAD